MTDRDSKPSPNKRGKRSRSRQCRGRRRRNMLRAAERSLTAGASEQEQETIVSEARAVGAIPTPAPKEQPESPQKSADEKLPRWYGDGEGWAR